MKADEIVVLDHGRIVERGTHNDLIQGEGLYRRIYELELKDQVEALQQDREDQAAEERERESVPAAGGGN